MHEIEDNRDRFIKEIKKLNQKLDSLTKTSSGSNDELGGLLLSLKVPQPNADEITAMPSSSKMPRFMRPTICSTRRSGTGHQISYKKDTRPARRKQLLLSRAESVSFPIKSMTESHSGSSISRASCLVGLNEICTGDNETEYIQDTSQCNFRTDIDKRESSSKNSTDQSVNSIFSEDIEFGSTKVSEDNHWLYLHGLTTNSSSYTHQNKRMLSIPTPVKKSKPTKKDKSNGREINDYKLTKVKDRHGHLEKVASGEITARPESETPRRLSPADKESRFNYVSPIPSTGSTKPITGVDDSSTEGDSYYQNDYVNGVDVTVISQVSTHEIRFSEDSEFKDDLPADDPTSDVDSSAIGLLESSNLSFSRSELKSASEKIPSHVGGNCEEQCAPDQHSVPRKKSCLYEVRTGLSELLKENLLIMYNSVLLGLGFKSLGFEHDFFQALIR